MCILQDAEMKSVGVLTIKNIATTKQYTYIADKRAIIAVSNSVLFNIFRSFLKAFLQRSLQVKYNC